MDTVLNILNWFSVTGTNTYIAGFLSNNSFLVIPFSTILYKYWRYRASKTPEKWDDEAVEAVGELMGVKEDEDEEA